MDPVSENPRHGPGLEPSPHPPPAARVPVLPPLRGYPSPHQPLTEFLDLLPLYAAALAVTLCGIAAVNITVDNPNLASLTVLLTSLGFAVSLALRMLRVDPNQAIYPLLGITLFITLQRVLGGVLGLLHPSGAPPGPACSIPHQTTRSRRGYHRLCRRKSVCELQYKSVY